MHSVLTLVITDPGRAGGVRGNDSGAGNNPSACLPLRGMRPHGEELVGIGLMVEVLKHAPAELGPSERMVLMAIAEDARDATRESWTLTRADLCQRTGMSAEALKKAFQRLAKARLEVRIPLKFDKQGKPVYAYEGKQSTYRIPLLKRGELSPASEGGTESRLSDSVGGTQSPHSPLEQGTQSPLFGSEGGTESQEGGTGSPPTPHNPSTSSPSEKKTKGGAGGRRRPKTDDEHPSFGEWYTAYPVHKARGAAVGAYMKALKKTDPPTLLAAAKRYRDDPQVQRGFGKHPATWLNQECWLDEPTPAENLAATGTDGSRSFGFSPLDNVNSLWEGRR